MDKVDLQTETGDFVATVEVPPFIRSPEVLIWGLRVFRRVELSALIRPVYREVFAYVVVR